VDLTQSAGLNSECCERSFSPRGYALADSLDAPLRIIQANVEESGEEGSFQRRFDRRIGPVACEGGFDSEALLGSKVFRGAP